MKIIEHFSAIEDPRVERTKKHPLASILVISVLATICGAEGWSEMAEYGRRKEEWLKGFIDLPNGVPSEDTFARVLSRLKPEALYECFMSLMKEMVGQVAGRVVAIDGKTARRSHDRKRGRKPLHLVSAWVSEHGLVLGQVATEEKSNEITAIPALLDLLDIEGAIVTIDAEGTQKTIVSKIRERGGHYILQLKANHPRFLREVEEYFEGLDAGRFEATDLSRSETVDGEHGRVETRKATATSDLEWFEDRGQWVDLKSIIRMERLRELAVTESNGEVTYRTQHEISFYISSLAPDAAMLARCLRSHWGVENGLHWVLDVAFHEDLSRVRKEHGPENLALLRKIALNLLKSEKTLKRGIAGKQKAAGWDDNYLLTVLSAFST